MKCIYCGEVGKGSICPSCYPSCINCNSKDIVGVINSKESDEYGKIVWCNKCDQILPVEFINQDLPINKMSNELRDSIMGVEIEDCI